MGRTCSLGVRRPAPAHGRRAVPATARRRESRPQRPDRHLPPCVFEIQFQGAVLERTGLIASEAKITSGYRNAWPEGPGLVVG